MASLQFALLLVLGVVSRSLAADQSQCSVQVDVSYSVGSDPAVDCYDTCGVADNDLWFEGSAYQRVARLTADFKLMVKLNYLNGALIGCSTVPYQTVEETAAQMEELEACLGIENEDPTTAEPSTTDAFPTSDSASGATSGNMTGATSDSGTGATSDSGTGATSDSGTGATSGNMTGATSDSGTSATSGDPTTDASTTADPIKAVPTTAAPTTDAPTTDAPTTAAPTTAAPTTAAPTTAAPTTAAPTTEAPTTAAPTTVAPTTAAPTTAAPTTVAPTTAAPTTVAPTTVTTTTAAPVPTCPAGFTQLLGNCYLLSANTLTRTAAVTFCQQAGASLAFIESQAEQDAVQTILTTHTYIGINDIKVEGVYTSMKGVAAVYFNWNTGEPNGLGAENCVVMRQNLNYRWNDCECSKVFVALCKVAATY